MTMIVIGCGIGLSEILDEVDSIAQNGFVNNEDLWGFYHMGNYDGNNNFIINTPSFPDTIIDLSGNTNNIALNNFAGTIDSGARGDNTTGNESCIRFEGTDDFGQIPIGTLSGSTLFTVQLGIKPVATPSWATYCGSGGYAVGRGFEFLQNGVTNDIVHRTWSSGGSGDTATYYGGDVGNNIFSAAYTFDGSRVTEETECFVEGDPKTTLNKLMSGLLYDIFLGVRNKTTKDNWCNFDLHWLAIYKKVLTDAEIQQNANANLVWI